FFALMLFALGGTSLIAFDFYKTNRHPELLRLAGVGLYLTFLFLALAIAKYLDPVSDPPPGSGSRLVEQRRWLQRLLIVWAIAGCLVDLLTDWPVAYRGIGEGTFAVLGTV